MKTYKTHGTSQNSADISDILAKLAVWELFIWYPIKEWTVDFKSICYSAIIFFDLYTLLHQTSQCSRQVSLIVFRTVQFGLRSRDMIQRVILLFFFFFSPHKFCGLK